MKSLTGSSKKHYPAYVDKADSKLRNSPELKGLYQKIAHLKNCRDFKQYEYAKLQLIVSFFFQTSRGRWGGW